MKLYNIFQDLILEEINIRRQLLKEAVSTDLIKNVIDNRLRTNITYRDYPDQPPSKRWIEIYNLGKTKAGNDAIRAFQIFGGSKTTPTHGAFKIFRLDRIESFMPSKMVWYKPREEYRKDGTDKSMLQVNYSVDLSKIRSYNQNNQNTENL